jgi:uroporphyrinogen decarboxylase
VLKYDYGTVIYEMTSKERFLTALNGGRPDRVPVCPDISNMIPCRRTGRPFWDIYLRRNPPLWKAYAEAAEYFGFDAWSTGSPGVRFRSRPGFDLNTLSTSYEKIVAAYEAQTPRGALHGEFTYMRGDPPTNSGKPVKRLEEDIPKLRWLVDNIAEFTFDEFHERKEVIDDGGIVGLDVPLPGIHVWSDWARHDMLVYAMYDSPGLVEELRLLSHEFVLRLLDAIIEQRPDNINIQSSGGITLQSPKLFRELSLPTLREVALRAESAGIPTLMHCCGKARALVDMCSEETALSALNPLEAPPLGDCDIAEVKLAHGAEMCLMGNLPTTTLMLNGTPDDVRRAAHELIDAVGAGGGFVLSTGDQCGRDTPDENIFAMIEEAHDYGVY